MIGEQPITVGDLVQTCIAEYVHFSTIDEPAPIGDHIGRRPKFLVRITILIQGQFVQSSDNVKTGDRRISYRRVEINVGE